MHRSSAVAFGVGLIFLVASPATRAQEQTLAAQVEEIFSRMKQAQGQSVWDQAIALEGLGAKAAPEMARRIDGANPIVKVAVAKALLAMEGADAQRSSATRALKDVIRGGNERSLRVLACNLLSGYGLKSEVRPLARDLDTITDPLVKIALLKALRERGRYAPAMRKLREFLRSDDFSVQCEAALALAELGNVDLGREILAKLKNEPTDRGRRAKAYLELDEMVGQLEKYGGLEKRDDILKLRDREIANLKGEVARLEVEVKKGGSGAAAGGGSAGKIPGGKLFEELFGRIRDTYVDEKKTKTEDLVDAAATGLVEHLDPFSSYMSEKMLTEFNRSIRQRYGGIGAVVQMDRKTGYLTIQRPIYGNPAYEAGLRTLDQVTEVEGVSTKGKTVSELVSILKGPPDTPVTVKVKSFLGDGEEHTVQIVRKEITLKSVTYDMLPGKIGYIQLSQFGHLGSQEVEKALDDLESKGMRGLIFDLRGNPGGLLSGAVEIADKFLDDDQLVVYSEGRKGTRYGARQDDGGPQVRRRRLRQPKHPNYPLILLVDENSASASEIVSGALQAHERAELVGIQTFGKGSVQNIFPLESMSEKAALRMTIAYYYLPDGRLIHRSRNVETWRFLERMRREIQRWEQAGVVNAAQARKLLADYKPEPGGVEPDYRVEAPEISAEKRRAYGQIYELGVLDDYVKSNWKEHKDAFHALARADDFKVEKYPGFDALWTKILESLDAESKQAVEKNDLRLLLRANVRRFTQDDIAKTLPSDYQEDYQLQAALLLLVQRTGQTLDGVPQLTFLKETFPEGVAKTRKPGDKPGEEGGEGERDFK